HDPLRIRLPDDLAAARRPRRGRAVERHPGRVGCPRAGEGHPASSDSAGRRRQHRSLDQSSHSVWNPVMPPKVSLTILALVLLAAALFGAVRLYDVATTERDGGDIFSRVDTTTDMLTVVPQSLVSREDRQAIELVVYETRGFGIPWPIWVVSREELDTPLPAEQIAEQQFAENPVESPEGAGDGLLMAVIVPESDHTQTEVA